MKLVNSRIAQQLILLGSVAAATLVFGLPAHAQTAAAGKNDAIYMYRGADREKIILEKARQEGSLTLYTSMATKESIPMTKAFEKKYGVKIELWRATSEKIIQRVINEGQAKRHTFDVVETNGPEVEMMAREKLLSPVYSPYHADLPASAIPKHRMWVTDRLNFFVVAFNTNKFKREDMPKTYEGFLDPKWKGQIGIEATDTEWMATIIKKYGMERGTKFFEKLSDMRPDVRKSHILLAEMVSAGEVPVALTVYNSEAESLKRHGGPIDWVAVEPVVGRPQGLGVSKNAPHPYAAMLFADWIISPEGQSFYVSMGRVPVSTKIKTNMNNFPYDLVDSITALDENDKWEAMWNKYFLTKK
jgi:iron(III) transport system substrate-binding protein